MSSLTDVNWEIKLSSRLHDSFIWSESLSGLFRLHYNTICQRKSNAASRGLRSNCCGKKHTIVLCTQRSIHDWYSCLSDPCIFPCMSMVPADYCSLHSTCGCVFHPDRGYQNTTGNRFHFFYEPRTLRENRPTLSCPAFYL